MESGAGSSGDELPATASHEGAKFKASGPSPESISQASTGEETPWIKTEVCVLGRPDDEVQQRVALAMEIVRRRTNWAMAGGLLPIPVFDIFAVAGVQLAMLSELSVHYGVPFKRHLAKSLLMTLLGSVLPYVAGAGLAGSIAKILPVLGWGIGLASISLLAGATTHATGVVFVQHFESGGTFLDFDPIATRDFFRREFEIGRREGRAISSTESA